MVREIKVKKHLRDGSSVKAHERTISSKMASSGSKMGGKSGEKYNPTSIMKYLRDNQGSRWETGFNSISYNPSDGYVESDGSGFEPVGRNTAMGYIRDDFQNKDTFKSDSTLINDGKIIFRLS